MEANRSGGKRWGLRCGVLVSLLLVCALCAGGAYFFLPAEYTDVSRLTGLSVGERTVAQLLGLESDDEGFTTIPAGTPAPPTATYTPRPTFTPTATRLPRQLTPTLPPTDTPRPPPTETPTPTPILATATPDGFNFGATAEPDLAATEVAEAIIDIITGPEALEGRIDLIAPDNEIVFAPGVSQVEFTWRWTGAGACDPPPDGYGFDLRVWPNRPDFGPLGIDEVVALQDKIFCDPMTGKRGVLAWYLSGTPAVQAQGAGSFLWDVALVKLSPYTPLYASPPREFEISLDYPEPGPFDPDGAASGVTCGDFGAWAEAQAFFLAADGPAIDKFNLDPDRNGIACDEIAPSLLQ